ncbi:MAG: type IV secretory system conjugative DNA transfer family protein [Oscillospiraceae bacterium]|nr:type IV secretory system conjugative DNA transfer family protein [Oscillospiraceae bacterium]
MKNGEQKTKTALILVGALAAVWFGLLVAPFVSGGLVEIIIGFPNAIENPFRISLCEDSLKTVLVFLGSYALCIVISLSSEKNYRRGVEYGSAKWGNVAEVNRKYADKDSFKNRIFTANVRMGLDGRKHFRNLNTLVVGGSGSGKSRFYAKVNLLQANTSFFVLDCKGELLRDTGALLEKEGYEIRVLDLLNMEKSHCFNPFAYLENDNDIQKLISILFKATTPKSSGNQDPFWDMTAGMLLSALIFYLKYEAPEEEQNFAMALEMLRAGEVREEDEGYKSALDELFDHLEMEDPYHIAVKYYRDYQKSAGKTAKSIQITLASKLEKFNLSSVEALTATDEMDIASIGEKKVALFALISDNDPSFNFLVSMLYGLTFETLFNLADRKYQGALPMHVHFLMDEFANVSLPDSFENKLSTMRSRNISASVIIQNISQLKALFEKQWESIVGNCDEFLYLGGNEPSTLKTIVEYYLGKETIDTNTYGKSSGRGGSYSTNYQKIGRELMDASELRMLDNKKALLFIRGEPPLKDFKYDILNHPNVKYTPDGEGEPYEHGKANNAVASMQALNIDAQNFPELEIKSNYELLSDEEAYEF